MASHQYRCRLSDPFQPHNLSELRNGNPPSDCFTCHQRDSPHSSMHYYCHGCDLHFHEDLCYAFPRKIRHPYHPQHPLSFTFIDKSETLISETNIVDYYYDATKRGDGFIVQGKCDWCGQDIKDLFYQCSICGFSLDWECCRHDPPLTIENPRSHEHELNLLPRPLLTPCDACGVIDARDPPYACHPCSYVVHLSCISLPRIIKITYHPHRLSHTVHLPPGKRSCGVCYRNVDLKYGAFACVEGCLSTFHSKCATHEFIWDRIEYEWEPEEMDEIEEIQDPFEKISEKEIVHFSHEHHLWLNEDGNSCKKIKQCQACALGIDLEDFYGCIQCEFFLHIKCANLPRKTEHVLHHHPLYLHPLPLTDSYKMNCSSCKRRSSGFTYKCKECDEYRLDVRCASVSFPLNHRSHHHPLYFFHEYAQQEVCCDGCGEVCSRNCLGCIVGCNFVLCFTCATYPDEVYYKYDKHLLMICYGEDSNDKYWCEICEKELKPKEWFYSCEECCITLHLNCLCGPSVYMIYGRSLDFDGLEIEIVRNGSSTRPVCYECRGRCGDSIFVKVKDQVFCSIKCWEKNNEKQKPVYYPYSYPFPYPYYAYPPPPPPPPSSGLVYSYD